MRIPALSIFCLPLVATAAQGKTPEAKLVTTTPQQRWISSEIAEYRGDPADTDIVIDMSAQLQEMEGFGACFNELGWDALSYLDDSARERIMQDLFSTQDGCRFNLCRMPLGANDFSLDWYSYCDTPGDLAMESFSIEHDRRTLIPFINNALKYNPDLRIWASPWCPPVWMKHNGHYACRPNPLRNDLPGDPKTNLEGTDMFIVQPEYLDAYARYFVRFLEAYRDEGIDIFAVAPQNEFNSCQVFPSCTWKAGGLRDFIGGYLGPAMKDMGVEIMFGTMERANHLLADTVLLDPVAGPFISWAGFQWRGKGAIGAVGDSYPQLKLMQTESECGDGTNSWEFCLYTWDLVKHYLRNGACAYEYWNIALKKDASSRWGWKQNSLISVDANEGSFIYNHEYYLMKHVSAYVKQGARMLNTGREYEDMLAFRNPDGSVVAVLANRSESDISRTLRIGRKSFSLRLPGNSINTVHLDAKTLR